MDGCCLCSRPMQLATVGKKDLSLEGTKVNLRPSDEARWPWISYKEQLKTSKSKKP